MLSTDQEYRDQIKEVGNYKLKDTHKWRERAIYFEKYGYYCPHIENTVDWLKFWKEEEKRIMEGLWIDGFYIPGLYYFYLNYLPIYQKQLNTFAFPVVYDTDYHTFLCLEHAIFRKEHFVVIKKRAAGFSLKFCVPLIRELWFSKGSPNYIACYEEAQVTKAWSDIIEPYREHLNTHTAWYRDFNPSKILNWRVAKDMLTPGGRRIISGRLNTLKGLILSKSPSKGVGGGAKFIFSDEAGVNPVLNKFLGYVKNQVRYGAATTGTIIVSGAVGELKHLEQGGLRELIESPEANGFYAVNNIWDEDNEFKGKKCGFFVPENWSYYTEPGVGVTIAESKFFGREFIDKDGNSDIEGAKEFILEQREFLKKKSLETYLFEISQSPLSLSECFQYRAEKVFPIDLINAQLARLEQKKDYGTYVELFRDQRGKVKHRLLDKFTNRPILQHPIKPGETDLTGVIQVWEIPKDEPGYGLYWAGVDIVRDSESLTSPSMNTIHIYKSYHKIGEEYASEKIVATYKARPKDKMDWFDQAVMLLDWYNAEALVENNVYWFIEEITKIKKQYRVARTPKWLTDLSPQSQTQFTKPFGVNMTPKLWEIMIEALVGYVKEVIQTDFEGEDKTFKAIRRYGVERIEDIQLLREMANYKPKKEQSAKDNYDSLVSFGLALLHAQNNEMKGIIQTSIPEKDKNYEIQQKSIKLLMKSSFLHKNYHNSLLKGMRKSNKKY